MQFLYSLAISAYRLSIGLAAGFSGKAKLWVHGRKGLMDQLAHSLSAEKNIVWFHCASLGEFEQGRPLIEAYKNKFPDQKIVLTFFSPSGYEIRKDYEGADYVFYLPIDTASNARQFLDILQPKRIFFIKYEFWFNYLQEIKKREIPCYLVSGIFRENQLFFRPYGKWALEQLNAFSHFFVQNSESAELLKKHGFNNYTVAGDTRFDRVWQIAQHAKDLPEVEEFCKGSFVTIFGSSWTTEDDVAHQLINTENYSGKIIIAPHEVSNEKTQKILALFGEKVISWSKLKEDPSLGSSHSVLLIDTIGLLSSIYQYGDLAVIGGGFGKGVHNVLEAATFGLPVLLGPNFLKFQEVKELITLGAAESSSTTSDMLKSINKLYENQSELSKRSVLAKGYVMKNVGATTKILGYE